MFTPTCIKPYYVYTNIRKLYKINQTLKYLPVVYIGNKELVNYVDISNQIVLKHATNNYKLITDPYMFQALNENYNILKTNGSICNIHLKPIVISYNITINMYQYLMTSNTN